MPENTEDTCSVGVTRDRTLYLSEERLRVGVGGLCGGGGAVVIGQGVL